MATPLIQSRKFAILMHLIRLPEFPLIELAFKILVFVAASLGFIYFLNGGGHFENRNLELI
jgi:hypothetical protein